jgi:hypothetical protein
MTTLVIIVVLIICGIIATMICKSSCAKTCCNKPNYKPKETGCCGEVKEIECNPYPSKEEVVQEAKDSTGTTEETESKPVVKKTKPKTTKKTTTTKKSSTAKKSTKSSK